MAPKINQSIPEVLEWRGTTSGDLKWMSWKDSSGSLKTLTFAQGRAEIERVARGLLKLGLNPQDRMGIFAKNRVEWILADMGAIHTSAIPVPIYATLAAAQVEHIAAHSEMRMCVVENGEMLARLLAGKERLPKLERVIMIEGGTPAGAAVPVTTWAELLALGDAHKKEDEAGYRKRWGDIRRDDMLTIVYTSGTTGDPKGVMLTHGNILSQIETLPRVCPIQVTDLTICYLPLAHIFERTVTEFLPIMNGNHFVFAESLEKLPDNIREFKPNYMLAVPRVVEKVYERILGEVEHKGALSQKIFWWAVKVGRRWRQVRFEKHVPAGVRFKHRLAQRLVYAKVKQGLGGNLRFIVSGAAPLDASIADFFLNIDIPVMEGYGLTESSPVIAVNPLEDIVPGTVGKMIAGIQVEIWEKTLQGAPPDVEGEIVTKGPHVMKGYYKDDKATREAVDREGWLHTGDIGKRDVRGYITITDRKKNIIVNSYGKNIAPGPIESKLGANPHISSIMVIGDKHKFLVALVVPAFDSLEKMARLRGIHFASRADLVANKEVIDFYRKVLDEGCREFSRPEQIRRFALLDHELTIEDGALTPTLKVKRRLVEQRYAAQIAQLYADEHEYQAEVWDSAASAAQTAASV